MSQILKHALNINKLLPHIIGKFLDLQNVACDMWHHVSFLDTKSPSFYLKMVGFFSANHLSLSLYINFSHVTNIDMISNELNKPSPLAYSHLPPVRQMFFTSNCLTGNCHMWFQTEYNVEKNFWNVARVWKAHVFLIHMWLTSLNLKKKMNGAETAMLNTYKVIRLHLLLCWDGHVVTACREHRQLPLITLHSHTHTHYTVLKCIVKSIVIVIHPWV